jgi:tRNA nucleotidyltransferase (CCA-adding enzyme)
MTEVIDKIKEAFFGYQLFDVGGFVRDPFMGKVSHDRDVATNATPSGMITSCKLFGLNYRYTKNSIAHGTITIEGIEVTTFRKDVSCDGRNATVEWATTIEEDLSRRDFTINAMAQNVYTGEIVDPFGGMQDIKNKIIRAVGNPIDRLAEDTLRALRAIRFANRFGFTIDPKLLDAIMHTDISNLSVERVREEFMKILETKGTYRLNFVVYKIIPELKILSGLDGGKKHAETVDVHSFQAMKHTMKVSDNPLKIFVALLHDIGKGFTIDAERMFKGHEDVGAEKIKEIMERMKFSNDDVEYAQVMVKNHMRWHFYDDGNAPTDRAIKRAIRDLPDKFDKETMVTDLIQLTWADCQANHLNKPEGFEKYVIRKDIYWRALEMIREKPEVKIGSGLELNGKDLIEMGFKPSPLFNTILTDILNKVIGEDESMKLENNKKILKKYVMDNYNKVQK